MEDQKDLYTLGVWTVKPGNEAEFINEWTRFANWTAGNIQGTGKAYLLRDEKDSSRFISFGPWKDEATIKGWRESVEFKSFVVKAKALCLGFEPNTLKVAATTK
jgi:heme-degrading monooxygenase HmoA